MADVDLDPAKPDAAPAPDRHLPIEEIAPNPDQPRKSFDPEAMAELAASIREKGILQPLLVRAKAHGRASYEIIAGERRWRAAQMAQLHAVPVVIRDFNDIEVLEVAIVENIQRSNLTSIEEAAGYRQLIDAFGHTQDQLSRSLGKSRSHIANLMRLLALPQDVQAHLEAGRLTTGHARALIPCENASELARDVIAKGLSVRQTEALAKAAVTPPTPGKASPRRGADEKDSDTKAIEAELSANLRMSVSIKHRNIDGAGEMVIRYRDLEQLDALCQMLSASLPDDSI